MLFSKSLALLAFPILAVAIPYPFPGGSKPTTTTAKPSVTSTVTITATATATPADQCSTGSIQCCNSVQSASSPDVTTILGLLGLVVDGEDVLVGLTCSPLSIVGLGDGEW